MHLNFSISICIPPRIINFTSRLSNCQLLLHARTSASQQVDRNFSRLAIEYRNTTLRHDRIPIIKLINRDTSSDLHREQRQIVAGSLFLGTMDSSISRIRESIGVFNEPPGKYATKYNRLRSRGEFVYRATNFRGVKFWAREIEKC